MRPVRYPEDHAHAGQPVSRLRTCKAWLGDQRCAREFRQYAWSDSGSFADAEAHPTTVTWSALHCPRHERSALRAAASQVSA